MAAAASPSEARKGGDRSVLPRFAVRIRGRRPETVFSGGLVVTMDARTNGATTVVVRDGRISAVGGAELPAAHPDADHVDLAGATLVPGFIDAHNHLSVAALHPCFGDATTVRTVDDLHDVLRDARGREPRRRFRAPATVGTRPIGVSRSTATCSTRPSAIGRWCWRTIRCISASPTRSRSIASDRRYDPRSAGR